MALEIANMLVLSTGHLPGSLPAARFVRRGEAALVNRVVQLRVTHLPAARATARARPAVPDLPQAVVPR